MDYILEGSVIPVCSKCGFVMCAENDMNKETFTVKCLTTTCPEKDIEYVAKFNKIKIRKK